MSEEHQAAPATGSETPIATIPSAATMAQATAQATAAAGGKKPTTAAVMGQVTALQQAETIKQLQRQMKSLEEQTKDTGKVFLATVTSLITSAFALVAALAWNGAIQDLFKLIFKPTDLTQQVTQGQVISEFGYALVVTIIVVLVIFYLTSLNTRIGGKSLIGEAGKSEEGSKKGKED